MPKKKELNTTNGSETGGDLANTSLTLSSNMNRASTPQPLANNINCNNDIDNPSVTTSGISSNTSSGSSLNKKVNFYKIACFLLRKKLIYRNLCEFGAFTIILAIFIGFLGF